MDHILETILTMLGGFSTASGGFWLYLRRRQQAKDANTELIMGLAHDKIVYPGLKYIEKGYVTKDEYDDLIRYFYEPYLKLGGDGTAERIMKLVQLLPLTLRDVRITESLVRGEASLQKRLSEGDDFERNPGK